MEDFTSSNPILTSGVNDIYFNAISNSISDNSNVVNNHNESGMYNDLSNHHSLYPNTLTDSLNSHTNVVDNAIVNEDSTVFDLVKACNYIDANDLYNKALKDKPDNLSLVHLNARSLWKNYDAVNDLLSSSTHQSFTIAAITETWLHDNLPSSVINIPNYVLIRNDRRGKRGGGVGLYVKSDIQYFMRNDFIDTSPHFESLFIEINHNGVDIII